MGQKGQQAGIRSQHTGIIKQVILCQNQDYWALYRLKLTGDHVNYPGIMGIVPENGNCAGKWELYRGNGIARGHLNECRDAQIGRLYGTTESRNHGITELTTVWK